MTVRDVDAAEAVALARDGYRVIDVRERVEWDAGHVEGATLVPMGELPQRIAELAPDRSSPLLLHCRSGARSARAAAWLVQQGYTDVVNMKANVGGWKARGGPWEEPERSLSADQRRRYARHIRLPEVGLDGQRRLLDAKVLLIGAGGLGSPAALYLAAAGIGTLGIVDDDAVDDSNLQRQVLHATDRIGIRKVDSAEMTLRGLNPETRVVTHDERLTAGNVERLIGDHDVVVDGTDNLETRYVLNDAAVRMRRPVVHGSVYRWDGLVTTFIPFEGPCYRCMHPVPPPAELAPDCDVAGVLGVLPGVIGTLQTNEVIKLLLGIGKPLAGRLLTFDALRSTFEEIAVPRDPACPACGAGVAAVRA